MVKIVQDVFGSQVWNINLNPTGLVTGNFGFKKAIKLDI